MIIFFYAIAILGAIAGGFALMATFGSASSAPQEAAGAALSVALAVIPYCFARAVDLSNQSTARRRRHEELVELLRSQPAQPNEQDQLHPMVQEYMQRNH